MRTRIRGRETICFLVFLTIGSASLKAPVNVTRHRSTTVNSLSKGVQRSVVILSYNDFNEDHAELSNATLSKMVRCNHETYALKHDYQYISPAQSSTKWAASRLVMNGIRYKTFAILSSLDDFSVIVWIDHDAIFYNMDISVEFWLDKMHSGADVLVAEDIPGYRFNAGLQIIRSTPWTKLFYTAIADRLLLTDIHARYVEQPIFYDLEDEVDGAKEKIQVHKPRHEFQALLKLGTDFRESSWVVHGTKCCTSFTENVWVQTPGCTCDLGAFIREESCRAVN